MMNLSTLKTLFLTTVFMLFGCLAIQAQVFIYPTKGLNIEIKLDEAGTLPDRIEHIKDDISELKIIGEINGTDLDVIREMAGGINQGGYQTDGILSVLDLSEARIVKGGHYFILSSNYSTSKDKIGEYVFYGCSSLTSITLPPHVTEIGNSAFYGCRGLTSLTLPSGVTKIGSSAFEGCIGLTSLTIPSGVTEIGSSAFKDCTDLTSLSLPSGITEIGSSAFEDCRGLTSLTIPSGVTEIGSSAFKGCTGLTSLSLPSGVTEIGSSAFEDCRGLTSLSLPSGITKIGSSIFYGCSGLTSLTLPSSITEIGSYAFGGCSGLTSLTLPSGITEIDSDAFKGCTGLKDVNFYINGDFETYLKKNHPRIGVGCGIKYYLNDEEITSIVVPSSVTTLGMYAFQRCSNLLSVYVSWPTPISAYKTFSETNLGKCTLYVPQGKEQDYWLADVWGDFGNIVEYDPTGIDRVTTSTDAKELSRYSVNGQRLSAPAKGLNIVKYSDGSVKKVVVQ